MKRLTGIQIIVRALLWGFAAMLLGCGGILAGSAAGGRTGILNEWTALLAFWVPGVIVAVAAVVCFVVGVIRLGARG